LVDEVREAAEAEATAAAEAERHWLADEAREAAEVEAAAAAEAERHHMAEEARGAAEAEAAAAADAERHRLADEVREAADVEAAAAAAAEAEHHRLAEEAGVQLFAAEKARAEVAAAKSALDQAVVSSAASPRAEIASVARREALARREARMKAVVSLNTEAKARAQTKREGEIEEMVLQAAANRRPIDCASLRVFGGVASELDEALRHLRRKQRSQRIRARRLHEHVVGAQPCTTAHLIGRYDQVGATESHCCGPCRAVRDDAGSNKAIVVVSCDDERCGGVLLRNSGRDGYTVVIASRA